MRKKLKELGVIDETFKIAASRNCIYIPVKDEVDASSFKLEACDVVAAPQRRSSNVDSSYEIIGDIAILDQPPHNDALGEEVLKIRKDVNVVLAATGGVHGQYRLKDLVFITGEKRTTTVYKEYGSSLLIDVAKAYFSPRLATERHRIANLAQPSEIIVDMFAGVGPFTIMLAKKVKKVIAFEINPIAVEYLKKNVTRNHVSNVIVCQGDAKDLAPRLQRVADRVIMNLPHAAFEFLSEALTILSESGGTIHYYDIRTEDEFTHAIEGVRHAIEKHGRIVEELHVKKVRSYAPHRYIIALDIDVAADTK